MEYKLIAATDVSTFQTLMAEAIREGWQLHGNLIVTPHQDANGYGMQYSQAAIKSQGDTRAVMSDLTENLDEILATIIHDGQFQSAREFVIHITESPDLEHYENPMTERIEKAKSKIKQAFIDAGWLTPEQKRQTQELVNKMAQTAQDMLKLPVTVREIGTLTGQEWYERFWQEYDLPEGRSPKFIDSTLVRKGIDIIAKKAAGIGGESAA